MKMLLVKETTTKFKTLDSQTKKILFEGRPAVEEEVVSEMEAMSVSAARRASESAQKPEEKVVVEPIQKTKLSPSKKLIQDVEIALDEYWDQIIPSSGKRRKHYTEDFIQGHKLAYHQLVENRVLTVAILRSTLKLPAQTIAKP